MLSQCTMMPDEYGCAVANRFGELLDDDADPFDLLIKAETEKDKQKKKKDSQKKTKPKKPGQKESQKERLVTGIPDAGQNAQALTVTARPSQAYGGPVMKENRGGVAGANRGTRSVVVFREHPEDNPQDFIPKPSYDADSFSKSRGGFGSGRGGYSRNSEYFNLRGKREYERHSGTGISPEEKRGGRGPWNWGSVQDTMSCSDLMEVTEVPNQSPEPPLSAEGEDQASEVDGEVVVQVAMEMTLDEWKVLQEMSRPKVEFNLRQADTKVPTKARVIHQSKSIENKEGVEDMEEEAHFLRRSVNDITSRMDINFGSLGRPARGGRGRGGRGGLVGPQEKDKLKFDKVDVLAPNPDDPEDFPALTAGQ